MTMPGTTKTVAHNIDTKKRTNDIEISENLNFSSLFLSDALLAGLQSSGFVRPSPIQLKAIPLGRCGLDLIVQAKSGTGKTCVFTVIALDGLNLDTLVPQVLVLAPTREIALQIYEVFLALGASMARFRCQTFIGGMPVHEDKIKIKHCHVVIGTPGRVKQLIEDGVLRCDSIRLFVLDEADKLLEESFQKQVNWIYSSLPENKQILALSATYPEYLAQHLTAYMRDPTFVRLNSHDPALLGIKQYYKKVPYHPLPNQVFDNKCTALIKLLSSVQFQQCLVFSNYQIRAEDLSNLLNARGWPAVHIAGSYDQRVRNEAMHKLKSFQCRILISTDLTSRGIDCDKVNLVINLDLPHDHETYLHRIGRAGRFGSFGAAVSLVSEGKEYTDMKIVQQKCNTKINKLPDPIPSNLTEGNEPIYLDDLVSSEKLITRNQPCHLNGDKTNDCNGDAGGSDSDLLNGNKKCDDANLSPNCVDDVTSETDKIEQSAPSEGGPSEAPIPEMNANNSALNASSSDVCKLDLDNLDLARFSDSKCHHSTPSHPKSDDSSAHVRKDGRELRTYSNPFDDSTLGDDIEEKNSDASSIFGREESDDGSRASDGTDYGVWLDEDIRMQIPELTRRKNPEYTNFVAARDEIDVWLNCKGEGLDATVVDDIEVELHEKCSNQLLKSISNYLQELALERVSDSRVHENIFEDTTCENEQMSSSKSSLEKSTLTIVEKPIEEQKAKPMEEGLRIRKSKNYEHRSTAAFLAKIRENAARESRKPKVSENRDDQPETKKKAVSLNQEEEQPNADISPESESESTPRRWHGGKIGSRKIETKQDSQADPTSKSASDTTTDCRTRIVWMDGLCYRQDYLQSNESDDSESESESDSSSDDDYEESHYVPESGNIDEYDNSWSAHRNAQMSACHDHCDAIGESWRGKDYEYGCTEYEDRHSYDRYDDQCFSIGNGEVRDYSEDYDQTYADWFAHWSNQQPASSANQRHASSANRTTRGEAAFYETYFHWYDTYMEAVNYWRNYRRWYDRWMLQRRNEAMQRSMTRAHGRFYSGFRR